MSGSGANAAASVGRHAGGASEEELSRLNPDQVDDLSSAAEEFQGEQLSAFKTAGTNVRRRTICCVGSATLAGVVLFGLLIVAAFGGISFSRLTQDRLELRHWPVADSEGYFQSFQDGGRWEHLWIVGTEPSFLTIAWSFLFSSDLPGIGEGICEVAADRSTDVDSQLPIILPYWLLDKPTYPYRPLGSEGSCVIERHNLSELRNDPREVGEPGIRATWLGHSSVLAEVDGAVVLFDPIFSERCSPVSFAGPKRYRPAACSVDELPHLLDAVLISHTHYDHLDVSSIADIYHRYGDSVQWFIPSGSRDILLKAGVNNAAIQEMVWWQEAAISDRTGRRQTGAQVVFTPGNHYSRRGLLDKNVALWGGYAILGKHDNRFWFAGDTAYCNVFSQIGKRLGPFQLSAIPIGAYSPRETMKYSHVNPEEAVLVHQEVLSQKSMAIHWGSFKLTSEPYYEPRNLLVRAVANASSLEEDLAPFNAVSIGGTVEGGSSLAVKNLTMEEMVIFSDDLI